MKYLTFILIATIFSFVCNAQTDNIIKRDSSKYILNTFNLHSFKEPQNIIAYNPNCTFNFKSTSRFTLYCDSLNNKHILYDNRRNEYFTNDALQPYSSFGNTILGGSINYLIMLLEKKK